MISVVKAQLMLTIYTILNDSCLVQLLILSSSHYWSTVTMSKGICSLSYTKISAIVYSCALLPNRNVVA